MEMAGHFLQNTIAGSETRKLNVYQAVTDAVGYVRLGWLVVTTAYFCQFCPCER
jgi:hypothetical protein